VKIGVGDLGARMDFPITIVGENGGREPPTSKGSNTTRLFSSGGCTARPGHQARESSGKKKEDGSSITNVADDEVRIDFSLWST